MEVKIHIETECPVPNQTKDVKITLENVENIGDLKKKLQPLLCVAACDMSVYFKTKDFKLENKTKLSNLYVQEGDTFIVHFVSVCDVDLLNQLLQRMREFVVDVFEQYERRDENVKLRGFALTRVATSIYGRYYFVLKGLIRCSKETFVPWNHRPTISNRHYFVQEGGMDLLAKIYDFSSTKVDLDLMGYSQDVNEMIKSFNSLQDTLETSCLDFLWNFSETKEDRQLVLKKIGLEPFLHSLLKDTSKVGYQNKLSVRCLAQYIELPDAQPTLAENKQALSNLFWLTFNATDFNHRDFFHREVPANTLFCCSNHPKAAAKLIENQFYLSVLEKCETESEKILKLSENDKPTLPFTPAIGYFFSLLLANIQTLPENALLPYDETKRINKVLESFLQTVRPSEIGKFQIDHNYVWITLLPFLQLALAGPVKYLETECDGPPTRPQASVKSRSEVENETDEIARNIQSSYKELSKSIENQAETKGNREKNSRNEKCCGEEFSNNRESLPYIFNPAEKIGLFCLCHLVDTPGNRDLFKKEKLVDYLICVRWFAQRCPELEELTPKLDGFEHLELPSLESIAKAYLSKCFGYKIM